MNKKLLSTFLAMLLVFGPVLPVIAEPAQDAGTGMPVTEQIGMRREINDLPIYDRFIIKMKDAGQATFSIQTPANSIDASISSAIPAAKEAANTQVQAVLEENQTADTEIFDMGEIPEFTAEETVPGVVSVTLSEKVDAGTFAEAVAADPAVEYVQPDYELYLSQTVELNLDLGEAEGGTSEATPGADETAEAESGFSGEIETTAEPTAETTAQPEITPEAASEATPAAEPMPEATAMPGATASPIDTAALLGDMEADIEAAHTVSTGAGIKVALIDSGLDVTHPEIAGRVVDGYDFVNGTGLNYDPNDTMGQIHGTHVAGLIARVAPGAELMPLKVFENGRAYTSEIIGAISYAEAHGAQVVNCSFGRGEDNPALREAIAGSGMLFVCAAGNDRRNTDERPVYPASYGFGNVISVTSLNPDMGFSYYSNYGVNSVDIAAVGRDVESCYPNGEYGTMSGTSVSAGYVSGAAALAYAAALATADTTVGAAEVKVRLKESGYRLSDLGEKVNGSRMLSVYGSAAGIANEEVWQVYPADDFDVHGYQPTPEENWELFSSSPNKQVAAMQDTTYVLKENGTVWAWGGNTLNGLGNENYDIQKTPIQIIGLTNIIEISGGFVHCLALKADGTVWGWGANWYGQVSPNAGSITCPVSVPGLSEVKQIDAGGEYTSIAVKYDGSVVAWGEHYFSNLGDLRDLKDVKQARASDGGMIALKENGSVWHWGEAFSMEHPTSTPKLVEGLTGVIYIDISNMNETAYAIKSDGSVWTWAGDGSGIADEWSSNMALTPVVGLQNIKRVVASAGPNIFAIDTTGNLWGWGSNRSGTLGDGTKNDADTPVQITDILNVIDVSSGNNHSVALDSAGKVWTWGQNDYCQLGLALDITQHLTPYCLSGTINGEVPELNLTEGEASIPFEECLLEPWQEGSASASFCVRPLKGSEENKYVEANVTNGTNGLITDATQITGAPLQVAVNAPSTGQYFFWARVRVSDDASTGQTRLWMATDDGPYSDEPCESATPNGWSWVRISKRPLTEGRHVISICPRGSGGWYDTLLVTTSYSYWPPTDIESNATHQIYEAESEGAQLHTYQDGNITASFAVESDPMASSGRALRSNVSGSVTAKPALNANGAWTQTVELNGSGLFGVWIRTKQDSLGTQNGVWASLDGGEYKYITINPPGAQRGRYIWTRLYTQVLNGGTHTLRINPIQSDLLLDKVVVSRERDYVPSNLMHNGYLVMELEDAPAKTGSTDWPMFSLQDDENASGGKVMAAPGNLQNIPPQLGGVSFQADIDEAGAYEVYLRAATMAGGGTRLWMAADNQNYWDVNVSGGTDYTWSKVQTLDLTAGPHKIKVTAGDAGVKVDQIAIIKKGYKTPDGMMFEGTQTLEMEEGIFTPFDNNQTSFGYANYTITNDETASEGASVTAGCGGTVSSTDAFDTPPLRLEPVCDQDAQYNIWIRAKIDQTMHSSVYYRVDQNEYRSISLPVNSASQQGEWKWTKIDSVRLPAGLNNIDFIPFESGAVYDQLIITRDLSYNPDPDAGSAAQQLTLAADETANIIASVSNVGDIANKTFQLSYSDADLQVADLCALTAGADIAVGAVSGYPVEIVSAVPGQIQFKFTEAVSGTYFSGVINVFELRAKQQTTTEVTLSAL